MTEPRCSICGGRADAAHDQQPHGFEPAPDPAAVAYVELAVAIAAIEEHITKLAILVERLCLGLDLHSSFATREHAEIMAALAPYRRRP